MFSQHILVFLETFKYGILILENNLRTCEYYLHRNEIWKQLWQFSETTRTLISHAMISRWILIFIEKFWYFQRSLSCHNPFLDTDENQDQTWQVVQELQESQTIFQRNPRISEGTWGFTNSNENKEKPRTNAECRRVLPEPRDCRRDKSGSSLACQPPLRGDYSGRGPRSSVATLRVAGWLACL